jgi:hypothetical protein
MDSALLGSQRRGLDYLEFLHFRCADHRDWNSDTTGWMHHRGYAYIFNPAELL